MASDRHHWYLLRVLNDERQAQADKRAWRATIGPAQPKPSTASRSVPWSLAAQKSWTACSPGGAPMRSYSDSYSATKGHDSRWVVMASDLVGRTGFEPVTSSVREIQACSGNLSSSNWSGRGSPPPARLLQGSGWVRGRLIASALIRGSHRPSAARSARVDQERVTLCARPRRRRPPRRQRHQAPRRVRPRPDTARHDPRRARRGRFDAEHHHGAALTSPSARPARSETRLRDWPGRSRPRRRRSAVLTGQGSSCRKTGGSPPWHRHQLDLGRPAGLRDRQARPRGPQW